MSAQIFPGRYTNAPTGEPITVFLIGMRVNRWWKPGAWWPVFMAMPPMLRHLLQDPDSGLKALRTWFGRTTVLITYWRSAEDLHRFASDTSAPHLAAWRNFTKKIGASGDVGVWHESYTVQPGSYESVYSNMPAVGLPAAVGHQPIGAGAATAKQRLKAGGAPQQA